MNEKQADVFVLTSLDDIAWLLNLRGNDIHCCPVVLSYLMMTEEEVFLFANEKAFGQEVLENLKKDGVTLKPYNDIYTCVHTIPAGKTVIPFPEQAPTAGW